MGEVRVTRKRSGGVAGRENCPLKGVVGRVFPRERPVPVKDSRGTPGEPWGRCDAEGGGKSSLDGVAAGVCGRDRSYETGGVGPPFGRPRSMSSNLRFGGRSGRLKGGVGCWCCPSGRTRWCRFPAAFCRRSSRTLFPRMDSNRVCTILATSHTLDTSLRACIHMLILSWQVATIEGTEDRI